MKTKVMFALVGIVALVVGCASIPQRDLSSVPQSTIIDASKVRVFTVENSSYPKNFELLGEITAYSAKKLMTDPPASKGDALKRLQIEAVEKGANGIINVTFDVRGTDTWGTGCWETVQASGSAVRFK